MIVRERIEIRVDVETKQLAERAAVHTVPTRLKQTAQLLDKEGF